MKQEDRLFEEYWKEREEKESNRIVRAVTTFSFFHSDSVPLIKEMMLWAYKKGIANSKTQGGQK